MSDPCQQLHASWCLGQVLESQSNLRVMFLPRCGLRIEGDLGFRAIKQGFEEISDTFSIRIEVPPEFPQILPKAFETAMRIPADYHKFRDGSLCLGSPLRQRILMSKDETLSGFVDLLLIPYLYNWRHYDQHGALPLGHLDHGGQGLVADYEQLFQVEGEDACISALYLLGLRKRIANKLPCHCGSGQRLGRCHNRVLNPLRKVAHRREFWEQLRLLRSHLKD